jgi:UDP-N-acetylmuramyl pentapeptide phosphotransferase/UDP-N-acetylglucosamine-1-phosphate transferase
MALVILRVLLFSLPFVLFYFWMTYLRQVKKGEIDPSPEFEKKLKITSVGGLIIVISGMTYLILNSDTNEDKKYIPPQTIDGKIEPGHFEDEKDPKG